MLQKFYKLQQSQILPGRPSPVKHYFFLLLPILLLLSGCKNSPQAVSRTGFYFDTVITITLYSDNADPLLDGCFSLCEKYENLLSRTKEESDIARINAGKGRPVAVSSETEFLIRQALSYAALTEGKIDPTVAPLMELWDFTSDRPKSVPQEEAIQFLLPHIAFEKIQCEDGFVTLADPEAELDLGFLAKGYIADRLKEYLQNHGIKSGIIDLGGNILTIGAKPDGSPYRIGVKKPFSSAGTAMAVLPVQDRSVVSSGVYERYFEQDGQLYHHILDPDTGYPVSNGLLSVTILSDSSLEGDALSTACFVLGLEEGMRLIEDTPGAEAIFITEDYELHRSSGLPENTPGS